MNNYLFNIIEQMGYHVLNPNQKELNIVNKNTGELMEITATPEFHNFQEKDNWIKIYNDYSAIINEGKNNHGILIARNDNSYATYDVTLCDGNTNVSIIITQYADCVINQEFIAGVDVVVENNKENSIIDCLKMDLYSNECDVDNNSEKLSPKECKTSTFMNIILEFLDQFDEIEKSAFLQRGLKYIIPSLTKAVTDMLEYWKSYGIPEEIGKREKMIKEYKKEINKYKQKIIVEQKKISELTQILDSIDIEDSKNL